MKDPNFLFNYQLTSFEWARDLMRRGYITREDFNAFVNDNDLFHCEAWAL